MNTERRLRIALVSLTTLIVIIIIAALANSDAFVKPPTWSTTVSGSSEDSSDTTPVASTTQVTPPPSSETTTEPTTEATTEPTVAPTQAPAIQWYPNPQDVMEQGPLPTPHPLPGDGESVTLLAGGDVLFHSYLINGGRQTDGSYDYNYAFQHMETLTAEVDFAYLNMEGTLAGEPYSGFPYFSAPDAVATAIAGSGFHMAKSANNHSIDKGPAGFDRTIAVLREEGLIVSGTRQSLDEPFYQLVDIGGVKLGFATFSYETIRQNGQRALNAIVIPQELAGRINSFSLEEPYMSQDFARMGRLATVMREQGAEIVVFNLHWGTEYNTEENWYQKALAQQLANANVDLIIGNGAHVVQPIKEVRSQTSEHRSLVYYSVGNLLSDQLFGTADSQGYAEDGMLAEVRFERADDGRMRATAASYIATYCYKVKNGDYSTLNTIVPVRAALQNPAAFGVEGAVDLLQASLIRTDRVMAGNAVESLPVIAK